MFSITGNTDIEICVAGLPPAKGGGGIVSRSHRHHGRVIALLQAAARALPPDFTPYREGVRLSLTLLAPKEAPPGDPTNFLGGIADALQRKPDPGDLGDLAKVVVYENDLQLRQLDFRQSFAEDVSYRVRVGSLGGAALVTPRVRDGFVASGFEVDLVDVDELALAFVNSLEHGVRGELSVTDSRTFLEWLSLQRTLDDNVLGRFEELIVSAPADAVALFADAKNLSAALRRLFTGSRDREDISLLMQVRRRLAPFETVDLDGTVDLAMSTFEFDTDQMASLLCPIVRSSFRLLLPSVRARLRVCAASGCGRIFLDRTKNGTKMWCSMATCGNRAKQRAYRDRQLGVADGAVGYRFT